MEDSIFDNLDSKHISTKDRVSVETFKLLRENGDLNITIGQVCKAAGITKSTFYYYFHSIDDVIDSFSDIITSRLSEKTPLILQGKNCIEQVLLAIRIVDEGVEMLGVAVASSRYIMYLKNGNYPGFHVEAGWALVVAILTKAIDTGEIPGSRSPEAIANSIYYIMRGVNHTWCMCGGNFNFPNRVQDELREYFNMLVSGAND